MRRAEWDIASLAVLTALALPAAAEPDPLACGPAAGQARSFCSVTCGGRTARQSCGDRQLCECRCVADSAQCRCRPLGPEAGQVWRQAGEETRRHAGQGRE